MLHAPGHFTGRAAALNGTIYAVTTNQNQSEGSYFEAYNPITNSWQEMTHVPGSIYTCALAACEGKIYLVGSIVDNSSIIRTYTAAYDPAADSWENKRALPEHQVYWDMQANVVGGKIYVISGGQWHGFGAFSATQTNYVYDPSNDSWSQKAAIPTPVAFYGSAVLDDRIYIMGGQSQYTYPSSYTYVNLVQIYDPKTDSWVQGTPLPSLLTSPAACSTTGAMVEKRIYVAGGINCSDPSHPTLNSTLVYDGTTGSWSTDASMPTARWGLSLVNVNDTLYALGGEDGTNWLTTNERYTPANYGTEDTPPPPTPTSPASTTLPTPSPTSSMFPSNSPTQQPTSEPTSTQIATPAPTGIQRQDYTLITIALSIVAIAVVAVLVAYLRKRK